SIEPFVTFALLHGESKVLDYNYVVLEPVEISAYVVSEGWLQKNQAIAGRFIRAFSKATDYAIAHESEVKTIIAKYTKLDQTQAQQITLPTFGKKLTVSKLQKMVEKLYKRGWIEKSIDASSIIYME
ncbi:ABC transporter substrate-binding protein, partial [bacterium]|nr:ABC transporter substrate-binding protein [bacterium]